MEVKVDRYKLTEHQAHLLLGIAKAVSLALVVMPITLEQCMEVLQITKDCLQEAHKKEQESEQAQKGN